jgi:hypothetical protein
VSAPAYKARTIPLHSARMSIPPVTKQMCIRYWSSPCSDAGHDDADYEEGPVQGKEILAVQPSRFSALLQS